MSLLTIQLEGICVHLGPDSGVSLPVKHRAVFPAGRVDFLGALSSLHTPTLIWPTGRTELTDSIVSISVTGVTTIDFTGIPLSSCVPHLHEFFPWMKLDSSIVTGRPSNGMAFIDFDFGNISWFSNAGAMATKVVIDFDTPQATIIIERVTGAESIHVELPATVTIENHADPHAMTDFGLTFLVAEPPLSPPDSLQSQFTAVIDLVSDCDPEGETDIGCSNSQFP